MSPDAKVGILGFGAYAPRRVMTNDEWAEYVDTSDEWITTRTGIKSRRIADPSEATVDLAEHAARAAIEDARVSPEQIDELIVATDTPEVYAPDTAAFLQHRLGLRNIPAYDLGGSGCAGWLLALELARSRIRETEKTFLVVGVELISRLMDWQDRKTCVLFGDGAGAAVLGTGDVAEILATTAGTDGSKASILQRETGGTRKPFSAGLADDPSHLRIDFNGREVFRQAVGRMSEASREVLAKTGRNLADVDLVVPHQANLRIVDAVARNLGVDADRMFTNLQEYGNTGSASIPLALDSARACGRLHSGQLVLLTAFGAGFHWGAALVQF